MFRGGARIFSQDHLDGRVQRTRIGMPVELDLGPCRPQVWLFRVKGDGEIEGPFGIGIAAQSHVSSLNLFKNTRVLRVKLDRALEVLSRLHPAALPSINIASKQE